MVEVDVILRGGDRDPILAHPPDTDSDITLQEWLAQMGSTNKGIKLDFKSVSSQCPRCVSPGSVGALCVPGVSVSSQCPRCVSPGYEWPAVQEMRRLCQALSQPVTFAVRAALVPGSIPQLQWLLQQCRRYSLTVWTGKEDVYSVEDLLLIRENFDKSRVYYDIFEPQNSEFKKAIGIEYLHCLF
ncbi:hypothetical protein EK904_003982 [Melospiza melodia maxima]|nr:hypothetical protein EK904_003982 [Melospiza melodia maxima]